MTASPLQQLRQALAKTSSEGILIPMSDAYQNEYVPDHQNRLQWLTGFKGSAGFAIVTVKHAAIFVDGRYTLQVKQQVNTSLFAVEPYTMVSIKDWLTTHAQGLTMGFDPWLHTAQQIKWLEYNSPNVSFTPLTTNPIDLCWTKDRPQAERHPAFLLEEHYTGCPFTHKIEIIIKRLKEAHTHWLFIGDVTNTAWLLNIRGNDLPYTPVVMTYALLNDQGHVHLFTDVEKFAPTLQKTLGKYVTFHPTDALIPFTQNIKTQHVITPPSHTPYAVAQALQAHNTLNTLDDPITWHKACKNKVEVAGAHKANQVDCIALTNFLADIAENYDQHDESSAADLLLSYRKQHKDFRTPSFTTISAVGEHAALPHYSHTAQTNRPLKEGNLYLVDSGGQYLFGTTDITRTLCLGGEPTPAQKKHYTLVLKGHIALATALFPRGTDGYQLDTLARQFLWKEGLNYAHGTGHGVGSFLNVHEGPIAITGRVQHYPLEEGMVLSNEPGYYLEGQYGIRIENLMTVKEAPQKDYLCFDMLTYAPLDPTLIDNTLLTAQEKAWLHAYHQKTWDLLQKSLSLEAKSWLYQIVKFFNASK